MKRPVWFRAMIALWGVWFAAALTEPAGLMSCPMHSGAAGAEAEHHPAAGAHQASVATIALAHEAEHQPASAVVLHEHAATNAAISLATNAATNADEHSSSPDHHSGQHQCSCLGDCCSVAPAHIAKRADVFVLTAVPLQTARVVTRAIMQTHARPAHSLPFANGPPAIGLA